MICSCKKDEFELLDLDNSTVFSQDKSVLENLFEDIKKWLKKQLFNF